MPGADKDQAIGAYAVALAETDPAAAVRWTEMLPAGDLRNNRTTKVLERWLDLNEKAARAWIENRLCRTVKRRTFSALQNLDESQPGKKKAAGFLQPPF